MGDVARLAGFSPASFTGEAGDTLRLTLYWQAKHASSTPYVVFVQLLDSDGVLRAQQDQQPGRGEFPTTGWVSGEVLIDPYLVDLPQELIPGQYTLVTGIYDPVSGTRLPITGAGGDEIGDAWVLGTVEVR